VLIHLSHACYLRACVRARVCVGILKERSAQRPISIDGHEAYVWTYAWSDLTFLVLVVLERVLVQLVYFLRVHRKNAEKLAAGFIYHMFPPHQSLVPVTR